MTERDRPSRLRVPAWAEQEREGDLGWVAQNADAFWLAAREGYETQGRGAIVVDTTLSVEGAGHPYQYFPLEMFEQGSDEDTVRLTKADDPEREFVTTLLKADNRVSTYRVSLLTAGEAAPAAAATEQADGSGLPAHSLSDEQILTAIACWLANTTEPIVWWNWDGEALTIDTGQEIERYDRATVLAAISSNPAHEPEHQNPRQSGEGERLEPPDLETLMAWADEGVCEAACPAHCVVEADGTCPHGNKSWLLELGLI